MIKHARRKIALLVVVLCLLPAGVLAQGPAGTPGSDGLGDVYYPDLGNGGYDALHYTLDLDVDVAAQTLSGTAAIEATATQHLSAFNLDFEGFTISELTVNGAAADFSREGRELTITPAEPLAEGDPFTVRVSYSGQPGVLRHQSIPIRTGWIFHANGAYVASEPAGAAFWYPANDHPLDKATYTFIITVPEPFMVAANGLLQDTIDEGDTTTYIWEASDPTASYLATVNVGEFVLETQEGPDGLPIRNYYPPRLAEEASYDFGRTAEMIAYFEDVFGPYPFEAYGVVVHDASFGFALENQTLSLFSRGAVTGRRASEQTVAHELVHMWYGDNISPAQWQDIWLNEGFATYGQWLWAYEYQHGREALDEALRQTYVVVGAAGPAMPPPGSPRPTDLFNASVYVRGGLVLHALRERIGDEAFFELLRIYTANFAYGNATTADFIQLAQEVSGADLREFFDGWLYEQALPDIPEMGLSFDRTPVDPLAEQREIIASLNPVSVPELGVTVPVPDGWAARAGDPGYFEGLDLALRVLVLDGDDPTEAVIAYAEANDLRPPRRSTAERAGEDGTLWTIYSILGGGRITKIAGTVHAEQVYLVVLAGPAAGYPDAAFSAMVDGTVIGE